MHRSAVVLFTGSVSRESRQKGVPPALLHALHASLARTIESLPGVDLVLAHDEGGFHLEGARVRCATGDVTLAAKIDRAVATTFAAGYERVVLLAGDIAGITAASLQQALARITPSQPVLGCSGDGGFYLLGLAAAPAIDWTDVAWCTSSAAASLRTALEGDGLRVVTVETVDDIDDRNDAIRAARQLLSTRSFRPLGVRMQSLLAAPPATFTIAPVPTALHAADAASLRGPPPPR